MKWAQEVAESRQGWPGVAWTVNEPHAQASGGAAAVLLKDESGEQQQDDGHFLWKDGVAGVKRWQGSS